MTLCCLGAVLAFGEARPSVDLGGCWTFRMDPGNVGETEQWFAAPVTFADTIHVPGAWEAQGFGGETGKLRHHFIGKGWYKRRIDVPADWSGRRVFLWFGGVHRYASVWVNGKFLGEHIGCLSPFEFDITDYAAPGTSALIAVRIDSEQRWEIDTLIGAWDIIDYMDTYWGGIWGHVRLEARNAAYLEDLFVEPSVAPARCRVSASVQGTPPNGAALRLDILAMNKNTVAHADATPESPLGAIQIAVADARLWTPDAPNLYVARLFLVQGDNIIDEIEARFGFRQITIDGPRILLNGQPYFLRGYGDDAIYPETMAAPSDEAVYRRKIAIAKEYGFNHVRHHSHMLPPEYYDVCDELGMLVSPELPIGYQQFYNRAKGPALELYKTEWAAAIRRFRNHPSIFDWCMGNEMYESVPIAPDLYRIAKELDTTRPVVDTDGLPPGGFLDGTRDRDTLDFYFTQFDVWNSPLDNPQLYRCPAPKKPVISHETGNYVTFPRLDQIDLFKDNFKPFWLIAARDKVQRMGLLDETPRWAENTEKLYTLLRKVDIETLRKSHNVSGYHWWLLQDYWTTSNGIIDTYFRRKPGVDREAVRQFNNDIVLLEDGISLTYRGGEHLQAALLVSNFGPSDLAEPALSYVIAQGVGTIAERSASTPLAPQGALTELAKIDVPLPDVDAPARIAIKVQLASGGATFTNEWSTWIYPARVPASGAPLFASSELLPWLEARGAKPLPQQKPYPAEAVYVSNQLTPELLDATMAGASLILHKPLGFLPAATTRFKTAWWLGSPDDNNAGTIVYDHPATRAMAPGGWCDAAWYRLLEGSDGYLLGELSVQPEQIIRGIEVACVCRNKSMLFQSAAGQGCIIVCGLNLDAMLPDGTPCPAAEWLMARLVEYAGAFPNPAAAIPEAFLRERALEAPQFSAPFIEGFARLVRNEGETGSWFTYRKQSDRVEVLRQTDAGRVIAWETAAAPESLSGGFVTIVFAGGVGWISQQQTDGFVLGINGIDTLRFDVCRGRGLWHDESNRVTLSLVPRRTTSEDTAGLFYLGVPRDLVKPGQPCRLTVKSLGAGSRRWFALHPYADVLGAK
jgi:hypothetical protein